MKHDDKPQQADAPHPQSREAIQRILGSDYYRSLQPLLIAVRGRVVIGSQAGTSGFLLFLDNGSWAVSYLEEELLRYALGAGEPPREILNRLDSPEWGDARQPLVVDLPYSDQLCDIAAEVAKAHGLEITGLAFGERCFNFCFPGGWELDTMIVPDCSGKPALRVFFEQW
jgi:hypothetical protein